MGVVSSSSMKHVSRAILGHKPDLQLQGTRVHTGPNTSLEAFSFVITPEIENHIINFQQQFDRISQSLCAECDHFICRKFGSTFLRSHGCTPKTGFQLVIQIASRLYFGYQPPSWETVNMRPFYMGRVDIVQVVLPEVAEFCTTALNTAVPAFERKALFFEAAKAHNKNILRASRGHGFAGHLYSLQEVLRDDEDLPTLFSDPTYGRTRPAKLMTDCSEWVKSVIQEGGWVMPDPEHVWVHYDIFDDE